MLRLKEEDSVQLEKIQDVLEAQVVQVDCTLVKGTVHLKFGMLFHLAVAA